MSNSFTNQTIAQIELFTKNDEYDKQVYVLPKHLDEKVARLHLDALGVKLTTLRPEQAAYIGVPVEGPYSRITIATRQRSRSTTSLTSPRPRGEARIAWADAQMPVLRSIRERFAEQRPLDGLLVGACLHVTAETANLMRALLAGARRWRCARPPARDAGRRGRRAGRRPRRGGARGPRRGRRGLRENLAALVARGRR